MPDVSWHNLVHILPKTSPMTLPEPQKKKKLLTTILPPIFSARKSAQDCARLEAFLNAVPGEFCGFYDDGSVAYSEGFCRLFDLPAVAKFEDLQSTLIPGDAAALEGQFERLRERSESFTADAKIQKSDRTMRIRGTVGVAAETGKKFFILWTDDITEQSDQMQRLRLGKEAAEKQQALFRNALEICSFPVWIRDGAGDLSWVNEAYASMLGAVRNEVCAGQLEIIRSPKNRSVKDMAQEALASGKPQKETAHVIVSGKRCLVMIQEAPLPGTNCTLGFALDKTDAEELTDQLERQRKATKVFLENLNSAVAFFSSTQNLEFYNTAFQSFWKLDESWLSSKPKLGDILEKLRESRMLPEQTDFRKYKQSWLDMFTRLIEVHEDMLYLPDGRAVRLSVIPHPMGGLMIIFEDVTSRLELESSYNTLMAVQRETLDHLAEGVVVYGGNGKVTLWNPSFLRLWTLDEEKILENPHIVQIVEQKARFFDAEEWSSSVRSLLIDNGLERTAQNGRILRNDGVYIRYATVPLPDGGVMVSYYDITDTTQVENALRDKNEALETAEQLKSDFLANVSYQLRTPLNAIMGFAEILNHEYFGALNARQKEYTDGIHTAGTKLVSLIDDILDLSTIEAGYYELKRESVQVRPMLENLYELMSDWARKQDLTIRLSCPDDIGVLQIDERRIKQALLKLLHNAITFTPAKGSVLVEASGSENHVTFTIADTGVGIETEHLPTIFQPFDRHSSSPSRKENNGAGLGLALVKKIIELHGGEIAIESKINVGTVVRVTIWR